MHEIIASSSRRGFMFGMGAAALGLSSRTLLAHDSTAPIVTFGMITDCHYADIPASGNRYYRESEACLAECVAVMNAANVDFLIELGDFKDLGASVKETFGFLSRIEQVFAGFAGPRYHVLGNHDMDCITKEQFMSAIENTGVEAARPYYSFDLNGVHFVVLDANYREDGSDNFEGHKNWTLAYVPPPELQWLQEDLVAAAPRPVIVFIHQLLDADVGSYYVKNAAEVRQVLESCGRVRAVFQGHYHAGAYRYRRGIHYCTLKSVIEGSGPENNAFAVVRLYGDGRIVMQGYRREVNRTLIGMVSGNGVADPVSAVSSQIKVDTRSHHLLTNPQHERLDTRSHTTDWSVARRLNTRKIVGTAIIIR